MIIGIGVDLIEVDRVVKACQNNYSKTLLYRTGNLTD